MVSRRQGSTAKDASLTLFLCSSSSLRTACEMGTIMAVVAVLLSHMDRDAVTLMKPNMILWGVGGFGGFGGWGFGELGRGGGGLGGWRVGLLGVWGVGGVRGVGGFGGWGCLGILGGFVEVGGLDSWRG